MSGNLDAFGLIEFKKAYVINSEKVCGDKLCGESERKNYHLQKNKNTPIGQFKRGIPIEKITCPSGSELVVKSSNFHPACVFSQNKVILTNRGWAVTLTQISDLIKMPMKEEFQLQPLKEYHMMFPKKGEVTLEVTPDTINNKRVLLIKGDGWHRLHLVGITISNEFGFSEFVYSQTSDSGQLYIPWILPEELAGGVYKLHATDGINVYEISIPITI